jgi:hypothetical protein
LRNYQDALIDVIEARLDVGRLDRAALHSNVSDADLESIFVAPVRRFCFTACLNSEASRAFICCAGRSIGI